MDVIIGTLSACIGGDRRYTDTLTVTYNAASHVVLVTVRETTARGGMDGDGGTTLLGVTWSRSSAPHPSASEVMRLVRAAIADEKFSFKRYGKPAQNFRWSGVGTGLNASLCQQALQRAREASLPGEAS